MNSRSTSTRATRAAVGKKTAEDTSRLRKESELHPEAAREAQKRTRNRLAQKAVRERRTAHIRHLERQLAASQRSDADRFQEILDENAKLRDSLRAVRKKLFSVAATVTNVANDIGPLLHLDNPRTDDEMLEATQDSGRPHIRSPSPGHSAATTMMPTVIIPEVDRRLVNVHETGQELVLSLGDEESLYTPQSATVWTDSNSSKNALESVYRALESGQNQISELIATSCMDETSNVIREYESDMGSSLLAFSDPSWLNLDSQPYANASTQSLSRRYPHSLFSDHLDFIQKLLQQNGYAEKHFSSPPKVVELMLREFLEECWPAMGPWFAITDSYETVKNICWWRLTKTNQALEAIQKSYRPTAIQQTLQYPSIIDWIPYPEIRDRLILNSEAYDIDQIICDMAEAYVVERLGTPGLATQPCNLLDLVQFSLQASMNPSTCHSIPVVSSISRDAWSKRAVVDRAITIFSSQLPRPFRVPGFKIHPSFFARYPSLYDPSAVADDAANIPASTIRLQRAFPLNQRVANSYIKVLLHGKCIMER